MSEQQTKPIITREMNLGEVVKKYPQTAEIMLEYGLHCVGCLANQFDTVEQGAMIHGLNEEEVGEMLFSINQVIQDPIENS